MYGTILCFSWMFHHSKRIKMVSNTCLQIYRQHIIQLQLHVHKLICQEAIGQVINIVIVVLMISWCTVQHYMIGKYWIYFTHFYLYHNWIWSHQFYNQMVRPMQLFLFQLRHPLPRLTWNNLLSARFIKQVSFKPFQALFQLIIFSQQSYSTIWQVQMVLLVSLRSVTTPIWHWSYLPSTCVIFRHQYQQFIQLLYLDQLVQLICVPIIIVHWDQPVCQIQQANHILASQIIVLIQSVRMEQRAQTFHPLIPTRAAVLSVGTDQTVRRLISVLNQSAKTERLVKTYPVQTLTVAHVQATIWALIAQIMIIAHRTTSATIKQLVSMIKQITIVHVPVCYLGRDFTAMKAQPQQHHLYPLYHHRCLYHIYHLYHHRCLRLIHQLIIPLGYLH